MEARTRHMSYRQRCRELERATGSEESCRWRGKWMSRLALGDLCSACERVRNTTSVHFNQLLLEARPETRDRILEVSVTVRAKWCNIVSEKLAYYTKLPHRGCAAYAGYLGGSIGQSKVIVKGCFDEYQDIRDKSKCAFATHDMFDLKTPRSQQLLAFAEHPDAFLDEFLEAGEMMQDYPFGSCVERRAESQHVATKLASHRGTRRVEPAATAARQRLPQIDAALEQDEEYDYFVTQWKTQSIFKRLLRHMHSEDVIQRMPFADKVACIYGCDLPSLFPEDDQPRANNDAMTLYQSREQARPAVPLNPNMRMITEWFKSMLRPGLIFSVHPDVFRAA